MKTIPNMKLKAEATNSKVANGSESSETPNTPRNIRPQMPEISRYFLLAYGGLWRHAMKKSMAAPIDKTMFLTTGSMTTPYSTQ